MKNITDKEIAMVLLDEHKLCASSLTNLVLESSCESLRQDATNMLNRTFQHQKQIFDLMSQKGWYQTQSANPQDVTKAQQEVGKIQSSFNMMQ
jgi:spore coat protein F